MQLRVFIGVFKTTEYSSYAITVYGDGVCMQMDPQIVSDSISKHRIILMGLIRFLNEISKTNFPGVLDIAYYAGDDSVAFEWNTEHLQDGYFAKSTQDVDLWNEIVKRSNNPKLELSILGKENILQKINKNEIKRAKRVKNEFTRVN